MFGANGLWQITHGTSQTFPQPTHRITSRQCRPAPSSPAYSPSWESSCSWLSSSPYRRDIGSPSLVYFSCLPACASWSQPPSTQTASTWTRVTAGTATATSWRGSPSPSPSSPASLTSSYVRRPRETDTRVCSGQPPKPVAGSTLSAEICLCQIWAAGVDKCWSSQKHSAV